MWFEFSGFPALMSKRMVRPNHDGVRAPRSLSRENDPITGPLLGPSPHIAITGCRPVAAGGTHKDLS